MARSRNIKPGFFTNEDLVELDFATRLLFAGLWTIADRDGRFEDRPKKIKIAVFPADNVDVDAMLADLARFGFIQRYEVNGVRYAQVTAWSKHQNPHHTEKASEIPGPNGEVTVKTPLKPKESPAKDGGNLADSGFLIPDSLIPDSLKEDKPPRKRSASPVFELPSWVNPDHWAAWHSCAKRKKATNQQKQLAVQKLQAWRDAGEDFAGALENAAVGGWQGLFLPDSRTARATPVSFAQQDEQDRRRRWEEMTGRKWPESGEVVTYDLEESETPLLEQRHL